MANKRMFALDVIDTDRFCDMPISARLLYYELGMRGDDEGFVQNPKKIMLTTGTTADDLKILAAKGYVILFDSGVLVITHWRQNNFIQKDRFHETTCLAEKAQIQTTDSKIYELLPSGNKLDTPCIQTVSDLEAQIRLDKTRKEEKARAPSSRRFTPPTVEEVEAYCRERGNAVDAQRLVDFYEASGWMRGKTPIRDWKACVRTWERNVNNDRNGVKDTHERQPFGGYGPL